VAAAAAEATAAVWLFQVIRQALPDPSPLLLLPPSCYVRSASRGFLLGCNNS
jgi:hypothetical protein